jgi:hypothetical protein
MQELKLLFPFHIDILPQGDDLLLQIGRVGIEIS